MWIRDVFKNGRSKKCDWRRCKAKKERLSANSENSFKVVVKRCNFLHKRSQLQSPCCNRESHMFVWHIARFTKKVIKCPSFTFAMLIDMRLIITQATPFKQSLSLSTQFLGPANVYVQGNSGPFPFFPL